MLRFSPVVISLCIASIANAENLGDGAYDDLIRAHVANLASIQRYDIIYKSEVSLLDSGSGRLEEIRRFRRVQFDPDQNRRRLISRAKTEFTGDQKKPDVRAYLSVMFYDNDLNAMREFPGPISKMGGNPASSFSHGSGNPDWRRVGIGSFPSYGGGPESKVAEGMLNVTMSLPGQLIGISNGNRQATFQTKKVETATHEIRWLSLNEEVRIKVRSADLLNDANLAIRLTDRERVEP